MSAGNENIFARWSRRKQAVRESETPPPDEGERIVDAAVPPAEAEPAFQQPAAEPAAGEPEAADAAEPLPRLEDLTAESDLAAFLRKGVPKALKSAAMRKMWSLDPAIRDYIGPSEYAWDFNQPGSMAGFGPLDASDDMVADFLSTMSGGARAGLAKLADAAATPSPEETAAPSPEDDQEAGSSPPQGPADAVLAGEAGGSPPDVPGSPSHSLDQVAAAEEPAGPAKPAEARISPARPRHGRAMPR